MADQGDGIEAGTDPGAASQGNKTVPLAALEAEREKRQALETKLANLEGRVEGLAARPAETKAPERPVEYSKADLARAVAAGTITQAESEHIWDTQRDNKVRADARAQAAADTMAVVAAQTIAGEIDKYKAALPDLKDRSSDAFKAVVAKFNRLVQLGSPSTTATELAALESVYGDPSKLRRPQADLETHQDTGGGSDEPETTRRAGPLKDFTPREKAHYGRLIDQGVVKDWDAARSELKFGRPDLRQRNAGKPYSRAR